MSRYTPAARPLVQCLRAGGRRSEAASATAAFRPAASRTSPIQPATAPRTSHAGATACFATSARQWQASPASSSSTAAAPQRLEDLDGWNQDPNMTTLPWAEKELMRRGTPPVGSRRRRAALQTATAIQRALAGRDRLDDSAGGPIPFELMPYQCFQEARKVLKADREDKLRQIAAEAAKIRKLEEVLAGGDGSSGVTSRGGVAFLERRLASLRQHVEELKILADINDPLVKRRFEDGLGDMDKPIYRYLAAQRWRGRPLRIAVQRIEQFRLAPDLLPPAQLLPPRADVELFFRSYKVAPGAVVDSLISEATPRLRVQVFDRGARLLTVAIVDADVPDPARDAYTRRCHFLAANIPVAPTDSSVPLSRLDPAAQLVLPWLPAFAQKGSPPHRLAVFVLEQKPAAGGAPPDGNRSERLDVAALQKAFASDPASAIAAAADDTAAALSSSSSSPSTTAGRDDFSIRSLVDKHGLTVVGCTLFRTVWDAGTAGVMARAGVPGADLELKPTRLPSLKPPRKARGWEAKHQGPKYRHLWKYTHRIATPRRKFVR